MVVFPAASSPTVQEEEDTQAQENKVTTVLLHVYMH